MKHFWEFCRQRKWRRKHVRKPLSLFRSFLGIIFLAFPPPPNYFLICNGTERVYNVYDLFELRPFTAATKVSWRQWPPRSYGSWRRSWRGCVRMEQLSQFPTRWRGSGPGSITSRKRNTSKYLSIILDFWSLFPSSSSSFFKSNFFGTFILSINYKSKHMENIE